MALPTKVSDPDPFGRKPQDNVFTQQRLNTFSPVPSPNSVITTLLLFGVFFLVIGGVITASNKNSQSVTVRYDNLQGCGLTTNCTVDVKIEEDMDAPVYVYYILTDFFQNYRRYVKSHADEQLRGINIYGDLSVCDPLVEYGGTSLYPCGLVAYSTFNDTFSAPMLRAATGNNMSLMSQWSEDGIAFPLDKEKKFRPPRNQAIRPESRIGPGGVTLPNVTDEHFIVWMRVAALPKFRKLYAKINYDLKKGDVVTLTVANNFPTTEKHFALTTISNLGVANPFIEAMYYIVGTICCFVGLLFFLKHKFISSRSLGVVKYYRLNMPRVLSHKGDVEMKSMEKKQESGPLSPTPISHEVSGSQ